MPRIALHCGPRAWTSCEADSPERLVECGAAIRIAISVPWDVETAMRILGQPIPKLVRGWALVDTAAGMTFVDKDVLTKRLGLWESARAPVAHADGVSDFGVVACRLAFPQHVGLPAIEGPVVAGTMEGMDCLAVLGREFIKGKVLEWDGVVGRAFLRW